MTGTAPQPSSGTAVRNFIPEPPLQRGDASLWSVGTLVLWSGCLLVGLLGFVLPYARPVPPKKPAPPIQAEILNVTLSDQPVAAPELAAAPAPTAVPPPPALTSSQPTQAPPLTPVAEPAAVVFALPVEGPVQVVEPAHASYAASPAPAEAAPAPASATPTVQRLTFGQGEGTQPAPDYPYRAKREGQEGVVTVRFTVGENGRVLAAETSIACPWPLLNGAALRVIRERWRFPSGPVRLYEVAIRFQLTR